MKCHGHVVKLSTKKRVDCSRMVVELVVEVIKSCVGLEGVYKGTTVS